MLTTSAKTGVRGQTLGEGFGDDAKLGVKTSTTTKSVGCSSMKTLIEKNQLIVNDDDTIFELGTFVEKGRSYEADTNCTDDLVACIFIFAWATSQQYFKELTDLDSRKRLLSDQDDILMAELAPIGYISGSVESGEVDQDGDVWHSVDKQSGEFSWTTDDRSKYVNW